MGHTNGRFALAGRDRSTLGWSSGAGNRLTHRCRRTYGTRRGGSRDARSRRVENRAPSSISLRCARPILQSTPFSSGCGWRGQARAFANLPACRTWKSRTSDAGCKCSSGGQFLACRRTWLRTQPSLVGIRVGPIETNVIKLCPVNPNSMRSLFQLIEGCVSNCRPLLLQARGCAT